MPRGTSIRPHAPLGDEFGSESLTRAGPDDVLGCDGDRGDAHQQGGTSDASSLGLHDAA
jgi:hypothetical protein